jgi:DNA-binding LacI/PurR family transcriptional regulator
MDGYRQALEKKGIALPEGYIQQGDFTEESGYAAMQALLSAKDRPTAVFAGNDVIAYGAMKAIKDAGLEIPRDISIVGFDDDFLSRFLNPPLTTVSLPAATLGATAARILIQQLRGDPPLQRSVILSTFLAKRQSCAAI